MIGAAASFLGAWASILGAVVAVVATLAAAWAVLRSQLAKETISLLQTNNEALEKRADALEHELAESNKLIERQGNEIAALRDTVSGAAAVKALTEASVASHRELMAAIGGVRDVLEAIERNRL